MSDDPRLRFRIWIEGKLIDEAWISVEEAGAEHQFAAIMGGHMALVETATNHGSMWLIECYDPAKPRDEAYLRIGSDTEGMVAPMEFRP